MKDPDSVESKKPWLSLGISRSTFYSRKRLGLL